MHDQSEINKKREITCYNVATYAVYRQTIII